MGRLVDAPVELVFSYILQSAIPLVGRLPVVIRRLAQAAEIIGRGSLGRFAADQRLDRQPQFAQINDLVQTELAYVGAVVRSEFHEPFLVKSVQCLPHRRTAGGERGREPALDEPLPGRPPPRQDVGA